MPITTDSLPSISRRIHALSAEIGTLSKEASDVSRTLATAERFDQTFVAEVLVQLGEARAQLTTTDAALDQAEAAVRTWAAQFAIPTDAPAGCPDCGLADGHRNGCALQAA